MKKAIFGFIIIIIFSSCNPKREYSSHFSSLSDTLIIKTEQVKGFGLLYYLSSIHDFNFKDSLSFEVILPENISDIKLDYEVVDYYNKKIITEKNIDSLKILTLKENSVCFLKGLRGKDEILIFDENNNKDFRDDSIRLIKEIDFFSKDNLFKCDYKIFNGTKYVTASNWINFGIFGQRDSTLYYLTSQHYTSRFNIDNSNYEIELFIEDTRFMFNNPSIALVNYNGIKKDTIIKSEIVRLDEYIKLAEGYYKFSSLANDGSLITFIKDQNFNKVIGLQTGMIAPSFIVKTVSGDTISSTDLKDKPILIVNLSGCGGPSINEDYKSLINKWSDDFNIIGLEPDINKKIGGVLVDTEDDFNKDFYKKYRNVYSSYDCYLINTNGRIISEFDVYNWESSLSKTLN